MVQAAALYMIAQIDTERSQMLVPAQRYAAKSEIERETAEKILSIKTPVHR